MKHQIKCAVLLTLLFATIYGCKKNHDQPVVDFTGNYYGTVTQHGVSTPDTFKFDSSTIPTVFSFYNAFDSTYLTITTSGNSIVSITGGSPGFGSFSADTVSGFGSLSGSILQFTIFDAFTHNGIPVVDTFSFVATKQ